MLMLAAVFFVSHVVAYPTRRAVPTFPANGKFDYQVSTTNETLK